MMTPTAAERGQSPQRRGDVGDLLDEPPGPGDLPEAVVLVEAQSVLVNGVDHHEPCSDGRRGDEHAPQRIGEQRAAQSLALERSSERQARQQHGRNLTRRAMAQCTGKLLSLQKVR